MVGALAACGHGPESVAVVDQCTVPVPAAAGAVWSAHDVAFTVGATPLLLDIAIPAERPVPSPVVLLVHGGAWREGSRSEFRDELSTFVGLGYAAVAIDYRLSDGRETVFPAPVDDVHCALRWIRANADFYGIDPERVVLLGTSAGGHLAAAAAYARDGRRAEVSEISCPSSAPDAHIAGYVSLYGPQDLRAGAPWSSLAGTFLKTIVGAFPTDAPEKAAEASPVTFVHAGAPPALFIHGTKDHIVRLGQAQEMVAALHRVGVPATLVPVVGAQHGFRPFAPDLPNRAAVCTLATFLRARASPVTSSATPAG
jgi:acetyl esterase/lipase